PVRDPRRRDAAPQGQRARARQHDGQRARIAGGAAARSADPARARRDLRRRDRHRARQATVRRRSRRADRALPPRRSRRRPRRPDLAPEHPAAAGTALASNARVIALRAAGRALALDPESRDAAELVTGLMLEPPRELPLELQRKLEADDIAFGRRMGRTAAITFAVCFCFLPFTLILEVTNWPLIVALFAVFVVLAVHAEFAFRKSNRPVMFALVGMTVMIAMLTRVFGTVNFVPGLVCACILALTTYPSLIDRPLLVIGSLLGGFVAPL